MSIGNAAWQTEIRIGKQAGAGTVAGTMYSLDIEGEDGLTKGQNYIERRPAYGGRVATSGMRKSDVYLPGGDLAPWAVGMDSDAREILMMMEMFYQNSAFGSGGGTAPNSFTFTPITTQPAAVGSCELYSIQKVTAASTSNYDEQYLDCVASSLAWEWSVGNPLTITPGVQALSFSEVNLSTPDGAAANLPIVGASELAYSLTIAGTEYTLSPDSFSLSEDNNMGDHSAAGAAARNRFTFGHYSGEFSVNVPRNSDYGKIRNEAGDNVGTLAVAIRPSTGTYTSGGGTLAGDLTAYVQVNWQDMAAGGEGDMTGEIAGTVLSTSYLQYTDLTAI